MLLKLGECKIKCVSWKKGLHTFPFIKKCGIILQVVTSEEIDSKLMLALIYNAKDLGVAKSFDCAELENKHFAL